MLPQLLKRPLLFCMCWMMGSIILLLLLLARAVAALQCWVAASAGSRQCCCLLSALTGYLLFGFQLPAAVRS